MGAVPIPQRKPVFSNDSNSIFGYINDVVDTAGELASEYLEFEFLRKQLWGETNDPAPVEANGGYYPVGTPSNNNTGINNNMMLVGAFGLAGVALFAALT